MKIVEVKAFPLLARFSKVFGNEENIPKHLKYPSSSHKRPRLGQASAIVRITTDTGLTGYGECYGLPNPKVPAQIIENLFAPVMIGHDARKLNTLRAELLDTGAARAQESGLFAEALSGVDIALWDILGKAQGCPISSLLGGAVRDAIPVYATPIPFLSEEESATMARELVQEGYNAIKIKVGRGIDKDASVVGAIRDAVGRDVDLMVDVNCGYDRRKGLQLAQELALLNVRWVEEPVVYSDLEGLAWIRRHSPVAIAAGENAFTLSEARRLLEQGCIDIIQIDIARAGGISGATAIDTLARSFHVKVAPHGVGSSVAVAAAAQWLAASGNVDTFEFNIFPNPLRQAIVQGEFKPENSLLTVPTKAGIGIDINEEALTEFAIDPQ